MFECNRAHRVVVRKTLIRHTQAKLAADPCLTLQAPQAIPVLTVSALRPAGQGGAGYRPNGQSANMAIGSKAGSYRTGQSSQP